MHDEDLKTILKVRIFDLLFRNYLNKRRVRAAIFILISILGIFLLVSTYILSPELYQIKIRYMVFGGFISLYIIDIIHRIL